MGFAMGSLLHDLIPTFLNSVLDYFANRTAEYLVEYLHMDWKEAVGLSRRLVDVGLELTNDVTKEYTPKHFEDELHGIAAATGVDYKLVRHTIITYCYIKQKFGYSYV